MGNTIRISAIFLFFWIPTLCAGSCITPTIEWSFIHSTTIFTGLVLETIVDSTVSYENSRVQYVTHKIRRIESFKNADHDTLFLHTPYAIESRISLPQPPRLKTGRMYLVYAKQSKHGHSLYRCSRTKRLADDAKHWEKDDELQELGRFRCERHNYVQQQNGWHILSSPASNNLYSVAFYDSSAGYIGGEKDLFKTYTGGCRWVHQHAFRVHDIIFNGQDSWILSEGGISRISGNKSIGVAAMRYESVGRKRTTQDAFYGFALINNKQVYIVGKDGLLQPQSMTDDSRNIKAIPEPRRMTDNHLNDIAFSTSGVGMCVGDKGTILRSDSVRGEWKKLKRLTRAKLLKVIFVTDNVVLIIGESGTILKSEDAGNTWQTVDAGLKLAWHGIFFLNEQNGWIVGENGTILYSRDAGQSWEQQPSPTQEQLNAVCFTDANHGWIVGNNGTILKTTTGGFKE